MKERNLGKIHTFRIQWMMYCFWSRNPYVTKWAHRILEPVDFLLNFCVLWNQAKCLGQSYKAGVSNLWPADQMCHVLTTPTPGLANGKKRSQYVTWHCEFDSPIIERGKTEVLSFKTISLHLLFPKTHGMIVIIDLLS